MNSRDERKRRTGLSGALSDCLARRQRRYWYQVHHWLSREPEELKKRRLTVEPFRLALAAPWQRPSSCHSLALL